MRKGKFGVEKLLPEKCVSADPRTVYCVIRPQAATVRVGSENLPRFENLNF